MRFASLGSGSSGNALLVESRNTLVLLDCGFGLADVTARLARIGLDPGDIDAIIVTHEHEDHAGGVARLARRHELPVYLTYGTVAALPRDRAALPETVEIDGHTAFAIGDIEVQPYPVPHDAREPVQFVLGDGAVRLGVLTDIGAPTLHVAQMLSGLEALVLESNHDRAMLEGGPYPPVLRDRIGGQFGHLENADAARLLGELDRTRLQHVIAAHLSKQNNTPELARAALAGALGCEPDWIGVATQEDGFAWRQIL
ncbi:MAG: MBL fold metallo-hydrolase [Betaproteobacteria bacterium SG8_41]|nr:MAG: MBL fold metallo-hydrolase [Betaproteobacteria bacterium SG8_41]